MSPLANALRRLLGQPRAARPDNSPSPGSCPTVTPDAVEFSDAVPVTELEPTSTGASLPDLAPESHALLPVAGAIEEWTRESGGWRILTTGPGEGVNRASVLLRLADAIVGTSQLGVLLVDSQSVAGMSATPLPAPSELIPGRVWFVTLEGYLGLEESLCRPVLQPGDTVPALIVLIDAGSWAQLDRDVWPDPRLVDALLDIRRVGDLTEDARLDETIDSGVLPLLGIIEVPSPVEQA
ncbi:MAG: hypothetical protein ACK6D3_22535 [Planctomycetaceae bacterium]|jgi:hypothetical protein